MNKSLVYTSDSMNVFIKNYVDYKFEYNNWIISDNYIFNEKNPRHSGYSIIATSPIIKNEKDLFNYGLSGRSLVNTITSLIPHCGLPSLISQKAHDFLTNRSVIVFDSSPKGWKTNYKEIKNEFESLNNSGIWIDIESMEVKGYSIIGYPPLKELEVMLNKIDTISEETKYLLFLNNSILSSANSNVFMLMGKALEIIDAKYPMETRKDRRIEKYFPELANLFGVYTIKKLFDLFNHRKETRHYIKDKKDKEHLVSHESLSEEERILLYKCTTNLITTVIRDQFGLPRYSIDYA